MKKFGDLAVVFAILLTVVLLVSCDSADEKSQSTTTALAEPSIVVPTAGAPTAPGEQSSAATPEPNSTVVKTDVVSVILTAAEATLYAGPGEDYPVVAMAFGGSNFPVTGISEDGLWWRLTCFNDSSVEIGACWVSADPSVAAPTGSTAMLSGTDIKPYIELTYDFLRAIQSGLTAVGSDQYLSHDLQTVVEAGRPLPSLFGIRDDFPSFVMTDLTDDRVRPEAKVRVRFNYDNPSFAIVNLVEEEGEWRINSVAPHNLVRNVNTGELVLAEDVIRAYYRALANDEPEAAFDLLTTEAQASTSPEALASIAQGLEKLAVTTMQPVRGSDDQFNYYVRLLAVPDEGQSLSNASLWRPGDNARWLTVVRSEAGWRIARILNSPILAEVNSWQRVNILPINMTLDIPADWTRAGINWAWSSNSLGVPGIGVSWAELGEYGGDESVLPRYRREISTRPIDLGWAQGTQYTFELMGGPGEAPESAESHMVVQTGRRAYDFYTIATDVEELDNMRPILQRMVAAVSIDDPEANAFNSVATSANFLATLLRDGTGASSLPYLSEELRARASDQSSLLSLLGSDTLFQSFNASWRENPAADQALVGVTLNYTDSSEKVVFTVQRGSDDQWLITAIENEQ